jgi:hypothetical protein
MVAMAAVGAGRDDAFVLWEARQDDVEEAAEGHAEQSGEDCAESLKWADDCSLAPLTIQ